MPEARTLAPFIHLRVRSAYSLLEGAVRPKELAELVRDRHAGSGRHRYQQSLRRI